MTHMQEAHRRHKPHAFAAVLMPKSARRIDFAPAMPRQPNPQRAAATLDFLVTPENTVLFLEAGPGHFFGAHPCAFLAPDGRSVDELEGYKRGSGLKTIALSQLA